MSAIEGKLFLTVDDEPDVCDVIADTLEIADGNTLAANSIVKGVELVQSNDFSLIFLDFNIPGGGAPAFIQAMQEFGTGGGVIPPIMLVTGEITSIDSFDGDIVKRIILKPFSTKQLLAEVEDVLGNC